METLAAGLSDVGLQRDHNEDCFAVLAEQGLHLVADGMGGHRAGDVASRLASEAIAEFFRRSAQDDVTWPYQFDADLSDEENRLLAAIRLANRQIYEHSVRSRDLRGMGTTVVGLVFNRDRSRAFVGHVGDSRAYRVRQDQIEQLTRDHSLLNDYLAAMPEMSEEQKSELPKNVITRALGMQDTVEVDVQAHSVAPGDIFVLCSDGLTGMVHDEDIRRVVEEIEAPAEACRRLVTMANEHGGEDNITAVVVKVAEADSLRSAASTLSPESETTMPGLVVAGEAIPKEAPPKQNEAKDPARAQQGAEAAAAQPSPASPSAAGQSEAAAEFSDTITSPPIVLPDMGELASGSGSSGGSQEEAPKVTKSEPARQVPEAAADEKTPVAVEVRAIRNAGSDASDLGRAALDSIEEDSPPASQP